MRQQNSRIVLSAALFGLLFASALEGGVVPGNWSKVDQLTSGTHLAVWLKSGFRVEGLLQSTSPDSLQLTLLAGAQREYPKSEIRRIEALRVKPDSNLNGTLIGLGAGFGAGAALGYSASTSGDITTSITVPVMGGIGAAIGTLVGYLSDKSRKPDRVLYRAAQSP